MNRFFKITAQVVGFLIILYILLMISLYIFVQTKDFKPIIEKTFYEKTGQTLSVAGGIKLSLFPWPGIRATNIIINNPKNFKTPSTIKYLAKIGKVQVTLHVADLFHGKINPENILLSDTNINMVTAESGKTNWQNLIKFTNRPVKTHQANFASNSTNMTAISTFPVIEISNANLHFINLKTKQRTDITNLQLRTPASRIPTQRKVTLDCLIKHNNPNTVLKLFAKTYIHLIPSSSEIDLKKVHLGIEWIQVKNKFKHPIVLLMDGKISMIGNDFKSQFQGKFGESYGDIELTANRQNDQITTSTTLKNLKLKPLVEILSGKPWITGTINATALLNTYGDTFHEWLNHLSGRGSLKVKDGEIYGLNMALLVAGTLNRLLSRASGDTVESTTHQGTTTAFASLSADFSVSNGVVRTSNFLLMTKQLKATGKGSVNLPKTTIDAKLLTTYANNPEWQLPLEITGSLNSPKVQPDTAAIAQKILKKKFQKDIGNTLDKVKRQFDKLF